MFDLNIGYGAGNTQAEGTAGELVGGETGVAGIGGAPILRAAERFAGVGEIRRVCGGGVSTILRGENGSTGVGAWHLLPVPAGWIFRRN